MVSSICSKIIFYFVEHPRVLILCCQSAKADQKNCFVWHPRELSFGYVKHWPQRSLQTEIQLSDKIVFYGIPGSCPSDMLVSDPILFFKPRFSLLRQLLNETKNDLKPSNTLQNNFGRDIFQFLISESSKDGQRTFCRRKKHSIRTNFIRKLLIVDKLSFY